MKSPFRTKICGVTRREDLEAAIASGSEAIGLNFVPGGKRCISLDQAVALTSGLKGSAALVGVFVNASRDEVSHYAKTVGLDYVQLHGDERAEQWRDFELCPLIKAIGWSDDLAVESTLIAWHQHLGSRLAAFLVDAFTSSTSPLATERGGTGKIARWDLLLPRPTILAGKPLILAGGLTPVNVAEAIAATHPSGVDTASGVEVTAGVKSTELMTQFVTRAHQLLPNPCR